MIGLIGSLVELVCIYDTLKLLNSHIIVPRCEFYLCFGDRKPDDLGGIVEAKHRESPTCNFWQGYVLKARKVLILSVFRMDVTL